jgi:hypothetical protein
MSEIGKNYMQYVGAEKAQETVETPIVETVNETVTENEVVETQVEQPVQETVETKQEEVKEVVQPIIEEDYDDKKILSYFEKKGKKLTSVDDLFKEPETKEDPLSNVSDDVKQFINYHKETGRGIEDFNALNKDYSKVSALDLAREKAIAYSNGKLSKANVDQYLEKKLNVDLTDTENLDDFDVIEIEGFSRDYLEQKISDQQKYKTPLERQADKDVVTLENGIKMTKAEYDQRVLQHQEYVKNVTSSVDNIANSVFKVKVDENGTEKVLELDYEYNKEDKHKMVSYSADLDKAFQTLFGTDNGSIKYEDLNEGLYWADKNNREKAVSSIVHKALAKQAEDFAKLEHNFKFQDKKMPEGSKPTKQIPIPGTQPNYGVKYSMEQFKN